MSLRRGVRIVLGKPDEAGPRIGYGTQVFDAETGERLEQVARVSVDLTPADGAKATIETFVASLDVHADAEIVGVCPHCGCRDAHVELTAEVTHMGSPGKCHEYARLPEPDAE